MAFPTALSAVVDNVTTISAAHVNNLETTLDITGNRPKFFAYNSASDANATGNNVAVDPVEFNTEVFDTGSNFATNTFNAPATGYYLLIAQVTFYAVASDHTNGSISIVTSNRTYTSGSVNVYAQSVSGYAVLKMMVVADMDALDTAKVTAVIVTGDQDAGIYGSAAMGTSFCGARII